MNGHDRPDAGQYTVRMHLGIDVREACAPSRTGKGQWTYGFTSELLERGMPMTLYTDANLPADWTAKIRSHHRILHLPQSGFRWHLAAAQSIIASDIDAYVSTVSYIVPALVARKKPVIPVVHDLIAFHNEPHDRKAVMIEKLTLKRAAQNAAMICTVSNTTRNDLLQKYPSLPPDCVVPIFAGPMAAHAHVHEHASSHIILCIGTLCPRKNQLRLIDAYAMLPDDLRRRFTLTFVGKRGWDDDAIVARAASTPGVAWRDYLPDDECEALMQKAVVFAFPSLYEGFGMPILDAFLHDVPVLTSDLGSMKEIAGDAAVLVDPQDTASIARGLESILTDHTLRTTLADKGRVRAKEFSWKRTVDLFLDGVERLTNGVK